MLQLGQPRYHDGIARTRQLKTSPRKTELLSAI